MKQAGETSADPLGYETLVLTGNDGVHEISFHVEGVHCAGCIQKIESVVRAEPSVNDVRLNFSTHRLVVKWTGEKKQADDFARAVEALGYIISPFMLTSVNASTENEERFLLFSLGIAGFAMGNLMLISVGLWTTDAHTMGMATRDFMHIVSALIAIPAVIFSGRPFFRSAAKALRAGHTNMDVPISLALGLACGMSLYETFTHGEHAYFDSAVMLMFFLLIGRYLDFRARRNARSAATDLLGQFPAFAMVIDGNALKRVPASSLTPDTVIRVVAGEKFPADGVVIEGKTAIDNALVTGESLPQPVTVGDYVYAGTVNLSAPVLVRVLKAAESTLLSDIIRLMEQAAQGQARYVRLADRAARFYTPVVHVLAACAFIGWMAFGAAWQDALMVAVTVLIITCPCALGLAVPVVQVLATGQLMKRGILIKSGDALERLAEIDTAMFDKTGTLTSGHLVLEGKYPPEAMRMAASLAAYSQHPLSRAMMASYNGPLLEMEEVWEHPGQGVEGLHHGQIAKLGNRSWAGPGNEMSLSLQPDKTELWLEKDGFFYPFYFADTVRQDAEATISVLKEAGINVVMLTGDRQAVASAVALQTGIDVVFAERKPADKYTVLSQYKDEGHKILMVGDGLNDAPVLASAHVSMAPGTAIDIAQNAADIVFMGDRLDPVRQAYKTACFSQKLVRQNFLLAVLYNIVAVPLAFAGMVTPLAAAIAMSGSSLVVIANSFRLRRCR